MILERPDKFISHGSDEKNGFTESEPTHAAAVDWAAGRLRDSAATTPSFCLWRGRLVGDDVRKHWPVFATCSSGRMACKRY